MGFIKEIIWDDMAYNDLDVAYNDLDVAYNNMDVAYNNMDVAYNNMALLEHEPLVHDEPLVGLQ